MSKILKWPKIPSSMPCFLNSLIMCCIDLDIHVPAMRSSLLFKKNAIFKCGLRSHLGGHAWLLRPLDV